MWTNYRQNRVSLIVASFASNTALDMARRMENEFWKTFPEYKGYREIFVRLVYNSACEGRKQTHMKIPGSRNQDIEAVVHNPHMADVVRLLHLDRWLLLDANLKSQQVRFRAPEDIELCGALIAAHSCNYSLVQNFSSAEEKFHHHRKTLRLLVCTRMSLFEEPFLDIFKDTLSHALIDLIFPESDKEVPLWLAFAPSIFVDIHYNVEDEGLLKATRELDKVCRTSKEIFREPMLWPQPMKASDAVDQHVLTLEKLFSDLVQKCGRFKDEIPRAILVPHPMLCGLWAFNILTFRRQLGQIMADYDRNLLGQAHIYNVAE